MGEKIREPLEGVFFENVKYTEKLLYRAYETKEVEDLEKYTTELEQQIEDLKKISPDHVSYLEEMSRLKQELLDLKNKVLY